MIVLTLGVFIAAACYGWTQKRRWMVIAFGSIPTALLTYYLAGIGGALAIGEGRFCSLPFGGFSVGSNDVVLVASVAFWLLVWIGILVFVTRRLSR